MGINTEIILDRYMDVVEAAEYLKISKDAVYRWIKSRNLPAYRIGGIWRLKASEIDEWVKAVSQAS
jgi:excisionase family DNA binding protein